MSVGPHEHVTLKVCPIDVPDRVEWGKGARGSFKELNVIISRERVCLLWVDIFDVGESSSLVRSHLPALCGVRFCNFLLGLRVPMFDPAATRTLDSNINNVGCSLQKIRGKGRGTKAISP